MTNTPEAKQDVPLVLVVDDDKVMRLLVRREMEHTGYEVIEAINGEEGLAAYQKYSPDIVLLDAMMPVMDGFTCCQLLRELPEGNYIPILMTTRLEDQNSVDRAFAAGATDYITKPIHWAVLRRRVQRIIQAFRAEAEIRKALEKQKELNELKSRFVSMLSHDFRTPLSNILTSTQLIQYYSHKFTEEKKNQHLHQIQAAVRKMNQLLNEILQISKAEAGKLEFNPAPLDLIKFCTRLVEEMQIGAGDKYAIAFFSQGDCDNAYMDESLLQHILTNLLSNAIKYSPQGGKIHFELIGEYGKVLFRIRDLGIGIPKADQAKLFNAFHRGSNVSNIDGTGLGLAFVKNCVELHGGKIAVESEVGMGTTFTVTLPLKSRVELVQQV